MITCRISNGAIALDNDAALAGIQSLRRPWNYRNFLSARTHVEEDFSASYHSWGRAMDAAPRGVHGKVHSQRLSVASLALFGRCDLPSSPHSPSHFLHLRSRR